MGSTEKSWRLRRGPEHAPPTGAEGAVRLHRGLTSPSGSQLPGGARGRTKSKHCPPVDLGRTGSAILGQPRGALDFRTGWSVRRGAGPQSWRAGALRTREMCKSEAVGAWPRGLPLHRGPLLFRWGRRTLASTRWNFELTEKLAAGRQQGLHAHWPGARGGHWPITTCP